MAKHPKLKPSFLLEENKHPHKINKNRKDEQSFNDVQIVVQKVLAQGWMILSAMITKQKLKNTNKSMLKGIGSKGLQHLICYIIPQSPEAKKLARLEKKV